MDNSFVRELGYEFGILPVMTEDDDQYFTADINELRMYTESLIGQIVGKISKWEQVHIDEDGKKHVSIITQSIVDDIKKHFGV